jgi:hypothetical protein
MNSRKSARSAISALAQFGTGRHRAAPVCCGIPEKSAPFSRPARFAAARIAAAGYSSDHKTCIMNVKLEPGNTYGWWINGYKFHGFRDAQGRVAVPYLLVFHVKGN